MSKQIKIKGDLVVVVEMLKREFSRSVEARINQRGAVKGAARAVVGIFATEHL